MSVFRGVSPQRRANHPAIPLFPTGGGPTTYFLDVSGGVTSSGALLKQINKPIAGSDTPTGAITKRLARIFTGAVVGTLNGSLRFYGNDLGNGTTNIDRVRIPRESPLGTDKPTDVGAGDFTIELWLKCNYADNASSSIADARNSNIFWDGDIWGDSRGWVAGVTRRTGPILAVCLGVAGAGLTWTTIYGATNVGDGNWHHVAITRTQSTGVIRIWVDGAQDASGTYTTGSLEYPDGVDPGSGKNNWYWVIGTEKHDANPAIYLSYNGYASEVRVSNSVRYTGTFTPPTSLFSPDANTVGLYHFDEATGTTLGDDATVTGAPTNGEILRGGTNNGPVWATDTPFVGAVGDITLQVNKALSGSVASGGTLTRRMDKVLNGAITATATVVKQLSRAFGGQVTSTGIATNIRTVLLTLAGQVIASGIVTRQSQKTLTGNVAGSGNLTKQTQNNLTGNVTPAGTLTNIKTMLLTLVGQVTANGNLVQQTQKGIDGSVTPIGILQKQISYTLVGFVTSTGTITKRVLKFFSGSDTPTGAVTNVKALLITLTGAVTPSGVVSKVIGKYIAGQGNSTGTITRQINKTLSGGIGPNGVVSLVGGIVSAASKILKGMFKGMFRGMK